MFVVFLMSVENVVSSFENILIVIVDIVDIFFFFDDFGYVYNVSLLSEGGVCIVSLESSVYV